MTTERLDIEIGEKGNGSKTVKRSIEDIGKSAKTAQLDVTKLGRDIAILGGIVGGAITAAAGLGVLLYKGFSNAAKSIKETAAAAKQLGIGVENFSRLDFAARSADLATSDLVSTVQNLQQRQMDAAKAGNPMQKLFKQLGVNAVDANGKLRESEVVLREISDIFQKMPDGTNKSALALKLFGTANQDVIKLLNQGSQGLDDMAKKSDELGYTLSSETAKGVEDFYDELDSVKLQIEAMYRQALPTLLPMLKDFSNLLNSSEFKDGFNTIIQGAATAIVKLVELASTVGNVTKFLGEEVAARVGGAELGDVVRMEEEADRIRQQLEFMRKNPIAGAAGDWMREQLGMATKDELVARLDTLRAGIKDFYNDTGKMAADAAKATTEAGKPTGGTPPVIDWTGLGRGNGNDGSDKAEREMKRLERELHGVLSAINPVLNAQMDLARAEDVLGRAVEKNLITQQERNEYLAEYEERLKDQLYPLEAINDQLEQQIKIAGMLNEERAIESQLYSVTERLKRAGIDLTNEETDALRRQLETLQEVDKLASAKEGFLNQSRGRRDEQFGIDSTALGDLVKSGEIGGTDKFNIVNQLLGGSLDDTQSAFAAQLEQFQEYYARVQELRDKDVLSAAQASEAMKAIKRAELDANLQRTSEALGAAAGLMQSNSKEAFEVGRAAAIGQAIVNTYTAATAAYQSAAAIPYVGWILGPAAAAGAIAAGMAQVSAIRSQQMPAYRTGGTGVVQGGGGTDSAMVAFRATPGETYSVNTPSQARAMERIANVMEEGGGRERPVVNQSLTIVQQGRPNKKTPEQNARAMRKETSKMLRIK